MRQISSIRRFSISKLYLKTQKGFTLVEVMVVVAVIGILAGAIVVNLNSVRSQGRDARRAEDINSIRTALELYYNVNGEYPVLSSASSQWSISLAQALRPYLAVLPLDPLNHGASSKQGDYVYEYNATAGGCPGQWYELVYRLENTANLPPVAEGGVTDCSGETHNYGVTLPGVVTVGESVLP